MQKYRVKGPCPVADVPPGGLVSREQVEAFGGAEPGHINFDVLVGPHLELVPDEPEPPAKKALK